LRRDHGEGGVVEWREIRGSAVGEDEAVVAAVVRLAHRRRDAHLGGDAADDQLADCPILEQRIEIGGVKGAFAGLVDDRLAGDREQLVDDLVAGLAAHQDTAHRALVADADGEMPARLLARRQVGEVGTVAFAGYGRRAARQARRGEQALRRLDRPAQQGDVVAERGAEPPGSTKSRCMSMMTSAQLAGANSNG